MSSSAPDWLNIHVGLPKTGTTALQHNFFSKHPSIAYLATRDNGGPYPPNHQLAKLLHQITLFDELAFDITEFRKVAKDEITLRRKNDCRLFLSEEGFTGFRGVGIGRKAQLVKDVFGKARIILVIRKPRDFLESVYYQHIRNPHYNIKPVPLINEWIHEGLDNIGHFLCPINMLKFYTIAKKYSDIFGRENVEVLLFEDLKYNPDEFIKRLSSFTYLEPDQSLRIFHENNRNLYARMSVAMARHQSMKRSTVFKNFRLPETPSWMLAKLTSKIWPDPRFGKTISNEMITRINDVVGRECEKITKEWNLNTTRYGYPSKAYPAGSGEINIL